MLKSVLGKEFISVALKYLLYKLKRKEKVIDIIAHSAYNVFEY